MKCMLKILKCFGALTTTGWNVCFTLMFISRPFLFVDPGGNVGMVYFFNIISVTCGLLVWAVSLPFYGPDMLFMSDSNNNQSHTDRQTEAVSLSLTGDLAV